MDNALLCPHSSSHLTYHYSRSNHDPSSPSLCGVAVTTRPHIFRFRFIQLGTETPIVIAVTLVVISDSVDVTDIATTTWKHTRSLQPTLQHIVHHDFRRRRVL